MQHIVTWEIQERMMTVLNSRSGRSTIFYFLKHFIDVDSNNFAPVGVFIALGCHYLRSLSTGKMTL